MKVTKKIFLAILASSFLMVSSCKTQGDLLWVTRSDKGTPPVVVSNFLARSTNELNIYPLHRLKIGNDNSTVYYKNKKIYDSKLFQMSNQYLELYRNSVIFFTDKGNGNSQPLQILRNEFTIIDLNAPNNYYKVSLEKPIRILSADLIDLVNAKNERQNTILDHKDFDYYVVKSIDFENQQISFEKSDDENDKIVVSMEKHKNPVFE